MRRVFCMILCVYILLSGCSLFEERMKEPVNFYYLRTDLQYDAVDSLIVSEEREAAGHRESLSYLLALYRMGPVDEDLHSPLPKGTTIHLADQTSDHISMKLGGRLLTDAEFSLACACLTLTCMDLTGVGQVTISNGTRSITLTKDNLILFDISTTAPTEESK